MQPLLYVLLLLGLALRIAAIPVHGSSLMIHLDLTGPCTLIPKQGPLVLEERGIVKSMKRDMEEPGNILKGSPSVDEEST